AAPVALKRSQRPPRKSRLHVGLLSFGRFECIVSSVFLLSPVADCLEPLVPEPPRNSAAFLLVWRADARPAGGPKGGQTPACKAGDLGGPPPGPRTAQIPCTDCSTTGT